MEDTEKQLQLSSTEASVLLSCLPVWIVLFLHYCLKEQRLRFDAWIF